MDWLRAAESLITSPWLCAVLFGISALDAFLPAVPSEPVIVLAGVYAAKGEISLLLVVLVVGLGVFAGDLVPYLAGRIFGESLLRRLSPGTKRRAAHDWVARQLAERGGFFLIATRLLPARFLPTLSAGLVGYPVGKYAGFVGVAAIGWSLYRTLVGYLGGTFFQDNELLGIGFGVALGLVVSLALEFARRLRGRSGPALPTDAPR
jgi:membrane-associated protein